MDTIVSLTKYTVRNTAFIVTDGLVLISKLVTGPSGLPR